MVEGGKLLGRLEEACHVLWGGNPSLFQPSQNKLEGVSEGPDWGGIKLPSSAHLSLGQGLAFDSGIGTPPLLKWRENTEGLQLHTFGETEPLLPGTHFDLYPISEEAIQCAGANLERLFKIDPRAANLISILPVDIRTKILGSIPSDCPNGKFVGLVRQEVVRHLGISPGSPTAKVLVSTGYPLYHVIEQLYDSSLAPKAMGGSPMLRVSIDYLKADAVLTKYSPNERAKVFEMLRTARHLPSSVQDRVLDFAAGFPGPHTFEALDRAMGDWLAGKPNSSEIENTFGVKMSACDGRYWSFDQAVYAYSSLHKITDGGTNLDVVRDLEISLEKRPKETGNMLIDIAPITGHYMAEGMGEPPSDHPKVVIYAAAETSGSYKLTGDVHGRIAHYGITARDYVAWQKEPDGESPPRPNETDTIALQKSLHYFRAHEKAKLLDAGYQDAHLAYGAALSPGSKTAEKRLYDRGQAILQALHTPGMAISKPELLWAVGFLVDKAKSGDPVAQEQLQDFLGSLKPNTGIYNAVDHIYGTEIKAIYGDTSVMGTGRPPQKYEVKAEDLPLSDPNRMRKFMMAKFGTVEWPLAQLLELNPGLKLHGLKAGDVIKLPRMNDTSEEILMDAYMDHRAKDLEALPNPTKQQQELIDSSKQLNSVQPLAIDGDYGINTVAEVKKLQAMLNKDLKLKPSLQEDGIFGVRTAEAWMTWLLRHSPTGDASHPMEEIILHEIGHHTQFNMASAVDPLTKKVDEGKAMDLLADFSTISGWTTEDGRVADGAVLLPHLRVDAHEFSKETSDVPGNMMTRGAVDKGFFRHSNTEHFVSDYAMTDPKEDWAESWKEYVANPKKLLAKSPEKFLFFNALDREESARSKKAPRYDDAEVLKMATEANESDAVTAKARLLDGLRNLSGQGNLPFRMRAETATKIASSHSALFDQLSFAEGTKKHAYPLTKVEQETNDLMIFSSSWAIWKDSDPNEYLAGITVKIDEFKAKPEFKSLDSRAQSMLARPDGANYVLVIGAFQSLSAEEKVAARKDPLAFLESRGIKWDMVPAPLQHILSSDDEMRQEFLQVMTGYSGSANYEGVSAYGAIGPTSQMLIEYTARKTDNLATGLAKFESHMKFLYKDGELNGKLIVPAMYKYHASVLSAVMASGLRGEVLGFLREMLTRHWEDAAVRTFVEEMAKRMDIPWDAIELKAEAPTKSTSEIA